MTNTIQNFSECLNDWGKRKIPFVFLIDFLLQKPVARRLDEVDASEILFDFDGFTNYSLKNKDESLPDFHFRKNPISFDDYQMKFNHVVKNLKAGNSFLVNLSVPTPIETNLGLKDIFEHSKAPYRFWLKDQFVCFSPEIFIKIKGKRISSFPMKGTIDASFPNAEKVILSDPKEAAEHATIVDLIRNDISIVADKVWVERYRYIEQIETHQKTLLQVSSEIAGILPDNFDRKFGDLLLKLLPAGSISGAPKPSTLQIIKDAEGYERGYYTGIMGYFDGENFESAVMIRYIENQNGKLVFKSGGGITAKSDAKSEYQELIDKVYLPFAHVPSIVL
ncbi:aminodeoxychorismate synthase component I [Dyadobacter frigoris]|uniref:Aminodeoxychorismate synthase component I n=1 Tax=Dyadobacter frigoris TaxID=2576211 RepID=A0A4U6DCL9_9BACT|nr:aminodeoxychorismate synthase component I [Dyadobacter frigoris]TKT94117.1 aminodeoxychorismate synthase component I [Dyadobacter frigoris]GLU50672.1 aminodeoxychorismate synthase component I [Dyadobacter frigoris]